MQVNEFVTKFGEHAPPLLQVIPAQKSTAVSHTAPVKLALQVHTAVRPSADGEHCP